jgi:hypothetical protein
MAQLRFQKCCNPISNGRFYRVIIIIYHALLNSYLIDRGRQRGRVWGVWGVWGEREQRSRGAEEQRSRGAEEKLIQNPFIQNPFIK